MLHLSRETEWCAFDCFRRRWHEWVNSIRKEAVRGGQLHCPPSRNVCRTLLRKPWRNQGPPRGVPPGEAPEPRRPVRCHPGASARLCCRKARPWRPSRPLEAPSFSIVGLPRQATSSWAIGLVRRAFLVAAGNSGVGARRPEPEDGEREAKMTGTRRWANSWLRVVILLGLLHFLGSCGPGPSSAPTKEQNASGDEIVQVDMRKVILNPEEYQGRTLRSLVQDIHPLGDGLVVFGLYLEDRDAALSATKDLQEKARSISRVVDEYSPVEVDYVAYPSPTSGRKPYSPFGRLIDVRVP